MTTSLRKIFFVALCLIVCALPIPAQDSKAAVRSFFGLLKAQKYAALYDYLPGELQQKTSREQMTNSMKRLSSFIVIEKMDIGRVQQKGDFAVIDTTIFGKLSRPPKASEGKQEKQAQEGKISVQQYSTQVRGWYWRQGAL